MNRNWIAPGCGALFVVMAIVAFALTGEGQDPAKKTAEEIANYYQDNDTKHIIGALLAAAAGIPLLFFAGWIRRVLRNAEGEGGMLSAVAFAGLIVIVAGLAAGASIHLALADYADSDKLDPVAISAINTIDFDFFLPFPVGMCVFLLSAGLCTVRSAALPKWLGWVAIVLAILFLGGPAGIAAFIGGILWIGVVGVLGIVRGGDPTPTAT
jgi:hypothetical protein